MNYTEIIEKVNNKCDKLKAPHSEFNHKLSGLMITFKGRQIKTEETTEKSQGKQVDEQVNTEVKRLLGACEKEQSRQELKVLLTLRNDEHFRKSYLKPALKNSVIEMTQPDSPKSPTQKYRLTAKGKQILEK